jgi:hypothetical protein
VRRPELVLVTFILAGLLLLALLGRRDEDLADPRRSTHMAGPEGSRALASALRQFGVPVVQRDRAWFGAADDTASVPRSATLALLYVPYEPTDVEQRELRQVVARGGALFLAGGNGVEACFGLEVRNLRWDSTDVRHGDLRLGAARAVLDWATEPSSRPAAETEDECAPLSGARADTLLAAGDGRPVALRLRFPGGGNVTALADSRYVSNRDLRDTDAGLLVLSWLLEPRPTRVVFDEYHQRFGRARWLPGAMLVAAWRWARSAPLGWAMLQLGAAALVALVAAAIRFGPARHVVERRRRSPVEHVDALAAGLERAGATETAVRLIVEGLRRRLRPRQAVRTVRGGDAGAWVAALAAGAHTVEARRAVARLQGVLRSSGGRDRVHAAALAVEDVWEALTPERKPNRS